MKKLKAFIIDLTEIHGNGDFTCPRCSTAVSPNDTSDQAYTILEPRVNSKGLKEVVIQCNTCKSRIHLKGFALLQKMELKKPQDSSPKEHEHAENWPLYRTAHSTATAS